MSILELATVYVNRVGGSPGYLEQMTVLCKRLPWQASDLSPELIDGYLTQALHRLAPSTVANHRRMLGTLLRFAAAERFVDASILRPLRRVKRPPPCPVAWSHADIRHLHRMAGTLTGGRKCQHSILMQAWILVAYSTGLRLQDLLAIRHDGIRGNRCLVRQTKTGQPHVVYLDTNALAAIRKLPILGPRIFGDLICRDKVLFQMRRLVKISFHPGSTRFLRRSGATYAEIAGMDASRYLGHLSPGMKVHYVDRLLLDEEKRGEPTAPPLELVDHAENLERV